MRKSHSDAAICVRVGQGTARGFPMTGRIVGIVSQGAARTSEMAKERKRFGGHGAISSGS